MCNLNKKNILLSQRDIPGANIHYGTIRQFQATSGLPLQTMHGCTVIND